MTVLKKQARPLSPLTVLAFSFTHLLVCTAYAQGVATDRNLDTVTINGTRAPLDPNLPTTTESRTADQLKEQNFVNVEDALKYLPNVTVRKRYIGDRNALVGGRSAANVQAPRALVYADGYLLSQFLGQFNAPRWNVVAPEELARVDVLYGPFSALYPGNSIGTTIVMTTRRPKAFEASARVQYFRQDYDDAGFSDTYAGHQTSTWLGNSIGPWTYTIGANRLENKAQPMQYVTLQTPSPSTMPAVPVTGAVAGTNPQGKSWYMAGPNGSAIENNTQEQFKVRLGYDISPIVYGEALYTYWRNNGRRSGATLLRDAAGNPVYAGLVSIDGVKYDIPSAAYAPQHVEEEHGMFGMKLTTRNKTGWNASVVTTLYDISKDLTRSAEVNPAIAGAGAGDDDTLTDNSGTGWRTIDMQATHTPSGESPHALAFGYHNNRYNLDSVTSTTADWRNGDATSGKPGFYGKTSLQALFAQDTWKISPQWRATLGMRYEQWKAFDGRRDDKPYPNRAESAWSPKASISWQADNGWLFKTSLGKGVRFPTVSELFQGSVVGGEIVNNNPGLRPELAYAKEFSAEKDIMSDIAAGHVRLSIFEDDIRDTIFRQTNIAVFQNHINIQNIDRVRTRGIELSTVFHDLGMRGIDVTANIAYARGVILANAADPSIVGNKWVRVPRVRANLIGSYRPNDKWMTSLAVRHSGRQYGTLENNDINPDTFGGVSSYTVWDAKVGYHVTKYLEASFGIDNLTDKKYYAHHPYPGRTFFGELRANFQ